MPRQLRDIDTIATGYRVVEKMEGNPDFPDAPPELAAMKKLLPDALSAYNNAKGRDMEAVQLNVQAPLAQLSGPVYSVEN